MKNKKIWITSILLAALLTGCGQAANNQSADNAGSETAQSETIETVEKTEDEPIEIQQENENALPNLAIRFGETEDRPVYEIQLEDNEVSLAFVRVLQEREQTIPIYVFDGSENTDVLQYYDIPDRYDIPDGEPEMVESEQAGEVYYAAPSRIMIFYQDAQIPGDYVKVGSVTSTEGLAEAVESNPLDAWENKRVMLSIAE